MDAQFHILVEIAAVFKANADAFNPRVDRSWTAPLFSTMDLTLGSSFPLRLVVIAQQMILTFQLGTIFTKQKNILFLEQTQVSCFNESVYCSKKNREACSRKDF